MSDQAKKKKAPAKTAKGTGGEKPEETPPAVAKTGGGLSRSSFLLIAVLVLSGGYLLWQELLAPVGPPAVIKSSTTVGKARIGGAFNLVDQNNKPVTQDDFKGRYMLIYFGYTFCPDVCPTSLAVMTEALEMIGDKADKVTPIFISVDSERDTPEQMKMYIGYFHPRMVGLSGTVDQITEVTKAYKAYFTKVSDDGEEDYLMDHSSIIYLIGPDGQYVSHFSYGTDASEMAKRLMEIL
ncbi:MAG TPA: SCO family protein [Rhodospirillales bacterium]|nr:SCO family protein [Rhodospirillales bacterium]